MPLEQETAYFNANRAKWLEEGHGGKWALVRGEMLGGFYDSVAEGYAAGFKKWAHEPFLVKEVTPADEIRTIHRLAWA